MTPTSTQPSAPAATSRTLVLEGIDWKTYSRLILAFAEKPGVRLTYDRGELEILAPLLLHEDDGRFLARAITILTEELGLPFHPGGSVTLRRRRRQRGIEADECFWIASAPLMAGRRRLDLRTDPPPDLALEIDVTHSSLDRLAIYASLVVPEVWRLEGDTLTFHLLANGQYQEASESRSFPRLRPADLVPFMLQARQAIDHTVVANAFRQWVRQNLVPPPPPPPSP